MRPTLRQLFCVVLLAPTTSRQKGGLAGIDMMSTDGGALEDVVMQNVIIDGLETPIVLRLGNRWAHGGRAAEANVGDEGVPLSRAAGIVRNIFISQVVVRRAGPIPCLITGYPGHRVANVTLSDMRIEVQGGSPAYDFAVRENSGGYPFNRIFGLELPAHAFFMRHVHNVRFRNIQVQTLRPDQRPAAMFVDATGTLENVEFGNEGGPAHAPIVADKPDAIRLQGSSLGIAMDIRSK